MYNERMAIQLAEPGWPKTKVEADGIYKHHFHAVALLHSSAEANILPRGRHKVWGGRVLYCTVLYCTAA